MYLLLPYVIKLRNFIGCVEERSVSLDRSRIFYSLKPSLAGEGLGEETLK